jgi:hypothetical protein
MAAYLVFERDSTENKAQLEIYWSKITATFEGHPVKVLAALKLTPTCRSRMTAFERDTSREAGPAAASARPPRRARPRQIRERRGRVRSHRVH